MAKVGFVSLGCAKNLVDSEVMMGLLAEGGFEITPDQQDADVIVVNTCGFIDRAKEESVDAILEMAREKERGKCRRLIVAGCLVERYRGQILREIPEVDAVVGVNQIPEILKVCGDGAMAPAYERRELYLYSDRDPRLLTTPSHSAYIKIAEGCDHPCSFCVIPKMRGGFRSRSIDSVVSEARRLAQLGVREVNLVAQDSTMFGWDRGDRTGLARLLRELNDVDGLRWIRFLYAYPNNIYDDLLIAIAECDKVCKYMDVPLQHASRRVLSSMKRGGNPKSLSRLIARIRAHIPEVTLRTTLIVGFPGETADDFQELLEFVEESRFDRLGAFAYSDEEDADSHGLEGRVPDEVKGRRKERLLELQSRISHEKNRALIGSVAPILIEGPSQETELLWEGRLQGQAPEIDGVVFLTDGVSSETRPGDFRMVNITEAHPHDLVGALVS